MCIERWGSFSIPKHVAPHRKSYNSIMQILATLHISLLSKVFFPSIYIFIGRKGISNRSHAKRTPEINNTFINRLVPMSGHNSITIIAIVHIACITGCRVLRTTVFFHSFSLPTILLYMPFQLALVICFTLVRALRLNLTPILRTTIRAYLD